MASRAGREYSFVPRVINPVKMERAVFFAADSHIRDSRKTLEEKMPWLRTEVVHDPQSALAVSSERPSVFLFDDTGLTLLDIEQVRAKNPSAILVLLSYQPFIQCAPPQAARDKYPYTAGADLVFAVDRSALLPETIILPAVRAAEDRLNIERRSGLKRFIFHIVDDEPRWFSQFLPVLYGIIGQRADVMITRTYEESVQFLFGEEKGGKVRASSPAHEAGGHGDDVVCLIADIFFPKGADLQSDAGRELIRMVNSRFPRIPVIIASKAKEALEMSALGFVLPKGDSGSLQKLKEYILNCTGLGDFLLFDDKGRELRRARNISEIYQILLEAEKNDKEGHRLRSLLEAYGKKDKFSTWLYMHSYGALGDRLRPKRSQGRRFITVLKRHLQLEMARLERMPLDLGGIKAFDLAGLLAALRDQTPEAIQPYSDNDIISSWLDRKGYSELAEELRPVHGSGPELKKTVTDIVAKWLGMYPVKGET